MAAHCFLRRPPEVRLHGKAGMSHSLLGNPGQCQLGRRVMLHTGSARVSGASGSREKVRVQSLVLPPWQ